MPQDTGQAREKAACNTHNPAGDSFSIGSAGQRQQHGRDYLSQCIHM